MRRRHTPRAALDAIYASPNKGYGGIGGTGVEALFALAGFQLPLNDAGAGVVGFGLNSGGVGVGTFARASVAWTKLPSGLWAQVASGSPRSWYSGMTTAPGTYAGYLAEGAAIQLVTPTASIRDMTDASWVKGATVTVAKTGTGIDGVGNSCSRVTGGAVAATNTVLQTLSAAASSRTYSCWILRVTGSGPINLTQDGATFTDVSSLINASTFTQVKLTASQLNASFGVRVDTASDVILVDFNQFEAGANASTPIDNAGTRAADVLSFPQTGNVLGTVGTVYGEITCLSTSGNQVIVATNAVTGGVGCALYLTSATNAVIGDGTTNTTKSGLADVTTGIRKRASCWGPSGEFVTGDGLATATNAFDGDINLGAATGIACQTNGGNALNGAIKNVYIWQTQLSSLDLQRITA